MRKKKIYRLSIVWALIALCACAASAGNTEKIAGLCFVAPSKPIDSTAIDALSKINANYICLMPYAFVDGKNAKLVYNSERQWWGERAEGVEACAKLAAQQGIKTMLKPHIWLRHGEFTGTLKFETESEWLSWEASYRDYILLFAKLAEQNKIEMLCIGTELADFVAARPKFWFALIDNVRAVYKGKLTYAENWDSYEHVPFWNKLDCIGIDAYFPLSQEKTPSKKILRESLAPLNKKLAAFAGKTNKQIVFTEFGFRSIDYAAKEPWQHGENGALNEQAQKESLKQFLTVFWNEDWCLGGFLWKWYPNDEFSSRVNSDYSIKQKAAEETLSSFYARFKKK